MHLLKDPQGNLINGDGTGTFNVAEGAHGKSLVWHGNLTPAGMSILPFTGKIVDRDDVPEAMWRYVVRVDLERFLVPDGIAMFANHSCQPNCIINDNFCIETVRPLRHGEEVTISYDQVSLKDYEIFGRDWDRRWNFACGCGTQECVGVINSYRVMKLKPAKRPAEADRHFR